MIKVNIADVVADNRFRKDLGDIQGLMESIRRIGLLNPITINADNKLIAGARRLRACHKLGWVQIPAIVVNYLEEAQDQLLAERDENTARKEMTLEELVNLGKALAQLERKNAKERQGTRTDLGRKLPNRPSVTLSGKSLPAQRAPESALSSNPNMELRRWRGETREVVAKAVGLSRTQYDRAKKVVEAANDPNLSPVEQQIAKQALHEMNMTGMVKPAYDKIKEVLPKAVIPTKVSNQTNGKKFDPNNNVVHQRKAVNGLVNSIAGGAMGLENIAIHHEIEKDEAIRWLNDLIHSRRIIESTIKRIRIHLQGEQ